LLRAVVFGASGSIGKAISARLKNEGNFVIGVSRTASVDSENFNHWLQWSNNTEKFLSELQQILSGATVNSVIWAQGMNFNDEVKSFDLKKHLEMYEANVTFIISSLQALQNARLLVGDARLCVISSIWQNIARQNKLSYCTTKSALQGLIQSLSIDLGHEGMLINAVLPGALDTEMTHANLSPEQVTSLKLATPLGTLPDLSDVTGLVSYLCSPKNTGITGQFIAADRGFSNARIL
jgi:NAD(P)-dependent dehydrogenase (short-subunit alcohol dehydrogenase family)